MWKECPPTLADGLYMYRPAADAGNCHCRDILNGSWIKTEPPERGNAPVETVCQDLSGFWFGPVEKYGDFIDLLGNRVDVVCEPGIRPLVEAINQAHCQTFASCEGHPFNRHHPCTPSFAYVAFRGDARVVDALRRCARKETATGWEVGCLFGDADCFVLKNESPLFYTLVPWHWDVTRTLYNLLPAGRLREYLRRWLERRYAEWRAHDVQKMVAAIERIPAGTPDLSSRPWSCWLLDRWRQAGA